MLIPLTELFYDKTKEPKSILVNSDTIVAIGTFPWRRWAPMPADDAHAVKTYVHQNMRSVLGFVQPPVEHTCLTFNYTDHEGEAQCMYVLETPEQIKELWK